MKRSSGMVVGLGSLDGGDDQLGLMAARRLRQMIQVDRAVQVQEDPTGGTRLPEHCEGGLQALWIIDAASATPQTPAGTHIRLVYPREVERLMTLPGRGTHAPGLVNQLRFLDTLGWLPARVTLHLLTADQFRPGRGLSPALEQPLADLIRIVGREVREASDADEVAASGVRRK